MLSTCRGAYLAEDLQPAMSSDIRGANQPAADMQEPYHDLKLVSCNFGMQPFSSEQQYDHALRVVEILDEINTAERSDFIFGCEAGGPQQDSLAAIL